MMNDTYIISVDIWQKILDSSDFRTQINLFHVCQHFNKNLKIKNLLNIDKKYNKSLN